MNKVNRLKRIHGLMTSGDCSSRRVLKRYCTDDLLRIAQLRRSKTSNYQLPEGLVEQEM